MRILDLTRNFGENNPAAGTSMLSEVGWNEQSAIALG
jgi:hypothetical protein